MVDGVPTAESGRPVEPARAGAAGERVIRVSGLELFSAIAAGAALLAVLGVPLALAVGLRGFWIAGAAPAFAVTMIAGTAIIAPWLGLSWSLIPVLIVTLVVGVVIGIARRRIGRRGDSTTAARRSRFDPWVTGSLIVAGAVIALRLGQIIGAPENISQTFDNIFHLNAVRYVLEQGNASPLHLGSMTSPDGTLPFYPSGWHAFASLIVQLTGVSVPVAVNAVVAVTSCIVWPVSIMLLTRTLLGPVPALAVATGALAASIPAFPILLMDYGVLYPFQLGLALLPAALAATLPLLRLVNVAEPQGWGWWALVLAGMIPGMAIAHPGAFVAWLALSAPLVVAYVWRAFGRAGKRNRLLVLAAFFLYVVIGAVLVRVLRPPAEARGWPVQMSVIDALWATASVSMWYLVPAVVVAAAVLVGVIWAVIDRRLPALLALAIYAVAAFLFIVVAALPWPQLRDALTGSWYNNLPRLAAILGVALVPLAAFGIARTWQSIAASAKKRDAARAPRWVAPTVGVAAGAALLVGMQVVVMDRAIAWASPLYRLDASSPLLTADEYSLLERLPEHVPEGVVVAGSPWTGASLAYAIGDRPVLMPHTLMQISAEMEALNDGLDTATPQSAACDAVRELGVGFVVDFGAQEVHPGTHPFPGLDDLADSDRVRLVDEQGSARLYEVVGCG